MANKYTDKMSQTVDSGKKAAEAVGGVFQSFFTGGQKTAGGAIGGVAGFVKGVGDTAFGIANGTVNTAFKVASTFKKTTAVALVIGAGVAVKKWMDNREKNQALDNARATNELMETKIANDTVQAHLESGKPIFDNPEARADFVKKYGDRSANAAQSQQQANAR